MADCLTHIKLKPLVILPLLVASLSHAQQTTKTGNEKPPAEKETIDEEQFHQRIETLVEESEEEIDASGLIEELELLRQRPLNLNNASARELRMLFFLNEFQINNLLQHRKRFGSLISMMELQTIDGFDLETIEQIQPYVVVDEAVERRQINLRDILERGNSQYFLRFQQLLEEQKGYSHIEKEELEANPNARYLGSPYRLYTRYRYTYYTNISAGFTAEKDPGEEFFRGSQPQGFDFYSAHLYLNDMGRIKSLSLGDYQVQFGQGVALWSGLAFGKSSESVNVKKNGMGLRQYTSVDENNFMRGVGTTIKLGRFEVTGFYSNKYRDANILEVDTATGEPLSFSSLQQSGLHRRPSELKNRNSLQEIYWGSNITYRGSNFHAGITGYYMELGAKFERNLSFYNQFDLSQNTNYVIGFDYSYIYRNFNIFGETAMSASGGLAILNGAMMSLDQGLSMSVVHRKYTPDYQSLLSAAFSENTRVVNEDGIYLGLTAHLSQQWSVNAYADHFSFPWMKFRTYTPSRGYDYLLQVNFKPERNLEMYARYRIKNKPLNTPDNPVIRYVEDVKRQNIRFHISYPVSTSFTLRNRVEWTDFRHGSKKEQGYLIYQDVIFRSLSSPWAVTARYAIFSTDGFDSRIYAYENDVLYAFSFPFYNDKGHRAYIVARYRLNRHIDLQARLAQTIFTNRNEIGSGLDLIEGTTRTEIKAQMRLRF